MPSTVKSSQVKSRKMPSTVKSRKTPSTAKENTSDFKGKRLRLSRKTPLTFKENAFDCRGQRLRLSRKTLSTFKENGNGFVREVGKHPTYHNGLLSPTLKLTRPTARGPQSVRFSKTKVGETIMESQSDEPHRNDT